MTKKDVLKNLKKLTSINFNNLKELGEEITCSFEDFEDKNAEYGVIFEESNELGYNFIAYVNRQNSTEFKFIVENIYDNDGYKIAVKIKYIY